MAETTSWGTTAAGCRFHLASPKGGDRAEWPAELIDERQFPRVA